MYRLITICAVSLLLLGCESPQQIVDRQAAEAREANWQRRYIQRPRGIPPPPPTCRRTRPRRTPPRGRTRTHEFPTRRARLNSAGLNNGGHRRKHRRPRRADYSLNSGPALPLQGEASKRLLILNGARPLRVESRLT